MIRDEFREVVGRAVAQRPDIALDMVRDVVREMVRDGALAQGVERQGFRCSPSCPYRRGVAFCAQFGEHIGPGDPPVACITCIWVFTLEPLRAKLDEVVP